MLQEKLHRVTGPLSRAIFHVTRFEKWKVLLKCKLYMFLCRKKPRNACVQYEARFLSEENRVMAEEAPSLLEFIQNVTPRLAIYICVQ